MNYFNIFFILKYNLILFNFFYCLNLISFISFFLLDNSNFINFLLFFYKVILINCLLFSKKTIIIIIYLYIFSIERNKNILFFICFFIIYGINIFYSLITYIQ